MCVVTVRIEGVSSLLQHKFGDVAMEDGKKPTRSILVQESDPRQEAERAAYRDKEGYCYFPGAAVARMLREAGGSHKTKGSRKSAKFLVPAAVLVTEDAINILNGDGKKPAKTKEFEVDGRPVTIPATKGRIMRYRPRWDKWAAEFHLEVDEAVLPAKFIHQLMEEGGKRIGIGDYRPEKGGPFGRFRVLSWEETN